MNQPIKTWQERMPKVRTVYQCSMNCSPRAGEGKDCGDCCPVKVYGDPIKTRDEEIADLRAELASRGAAQGHTTD